MQKAVVVCGGSKGIGAASVRLLLEQGTKVFCLARSIGELADLSENRNLNYVKCDLSDEKSRKVAMSQLKEEKTFWGLVNNAAGPSTGSFLSSSRGEYLEAFESHLFAADDFSKFIVSKMSGETGGRIINIISVTARNPLENMCVSNTLRGAMLNWSKTLSKELGPNNITVNNVLPGYTETNRLLEVIKGVSLKSNVSEQMYRDKLISQIPLRRFGRPSEIATVVRFLLSEEAAFVNGASIPVDGGWTPCT